MLQVCTAKMGTPLRLRHFISLFEPINDNNILQYMLQLINFECISLMQHLWPQSWIYLQTDTCHLLLFQLQIHNYNIHDKYTCTTVMNKTSGQLQCKTQSTIRRRNHHRQRQMITKQCRQCNKHNTLGQLNHTQNLVAPCRLPASTDTSDPFPVRLSQEGN